MHNRDLIVSGNSVYLRLHKRKNSLSSTHLHRICTCDLNESASCPVGAARSVLTTHKRTLSPSYFLLERCTFTQSRTDSNNVSSHSFRRAFTTDLTLA